MAERQNTGTGSCGESTLVDGTVATYVVHAPHRQIRQSSLTELDGEN